MKTVLIDNLTNSVICQTTEKRIVPLIKMLVLDVNTVTLLPKRHEHWYNKLTNEFINDSMIRYSLNKGTADFATIDELPEAILLKKKIAIEKTYILEKLISCADIKMNNFHTFFHPSFVDIIERNDEVLLEEYAFVRKLPMEEVRKDLLVRKSIYETHLVKSQALIDMWVDKIMFETDLNILHSYQERVIDSFFRP